MLPLLAWDTEERCYVPLGLTLLPEYHAREAARFGGWRWDEWCNADADMRISVIGHWMASRLFAAHESDAIALKHEADAEKARQHRG